MSISSRYAGRILVLLLAISCAILYLYSPGTGDMLTQKAWLDGANTLGVKSFYLTWIDYPPGTISSFYLADLIFPGNSFGAIKLLILFSLFASSALIGLWKKNIDAATVTIFIFIPGSVALGYIDIVFAPYLIISLWALSRRRAAIFGLFFAISCFIKWQPMILLPFALIFLLGNEQTLTISKRIQQVLTAIFSIVVVIIVFGLTFTFDAINQSFSRAFNLPYFTGNALNFNWILTWLNNGAFGRMRWSYIEDVASWMPTLSKSIMWILLALVFAGFVLSARSFKLFLASSMAAYYVYSAWNINVHENHMFIPALLAVLLLFSNSTLKYESILVIALYEINMMGLYGLTGEQSIGLRMIGNFDLTLPIAFIFTIGSLYVAYQNLILCKIKLHQRSISKISRQIIFGNN